MKGDVILEEGEIVEPVTYVNAAFCWSWSERFDYLWNWGCT